MMRLTEDADRMVTVEATGVIRKKDYEELVPLLETKIGRRGKLDALLDIEGIERIEPAALLEDLRFDIRNRGNFRRVAIVGGGRLGDVATKITKPFFGGEIRHFEASELDVAKQWLAHA